MKLASLILTIILIQGIVAQTDEVGKPVDLDDNQQDGTVLLTCNFQEVQTVEWIKEGMILKETKKTLNLGSIFEDPQNVFWCRNLTNTPKKKSSPLHVYYRMCQNCMKLDGVTLSGLILAEIITLFLLAVGIYFIARQDGVWQSRASDKQTLLTNDQLYQPLRDREDDQYSHLQGSHPRKK
ncbi:T-cell surface glycoprotein CD3 gamma chain isoform X2 [Monodelphis domestica]|uniref:T-cell surface glycoprotein CD3 delta chain n=1 Tax=Monodelphis domestica TaxID=13616 RepID=F7F8D9_MONDO|nr:T-cell surface glycoprotein CD3 gamma chain isoform X2 [Monodelphis domestica]